MNWKRIENGKVAVVSENDMMILAVAEGVSRRLVAARVRKAATPGYGNGNRARRRIQALMTTEAGAELAGRL